jgi:hypothetical protein
MKISFCSDANVLADGKRDHAKDYPYQQHWTWRDGFVVVCSESRRLHMRAIEDCGGFLRFKAKIQKMLQSALSEFS